MRDFSLDIEAKKINSSKTRKYFKEVLSSYNNENYRATIVTLFSVVICDLLFKLESLSDLYSDSTAESILDEIKAFQAAHPNKPDWETNLVDQVFTRTKLLDNVNYTHILNLKTLRNLCAHPVIDQDNILYTPNQDTARANIRNMMESLLLKPPILSKKILETLLTDIADKKDILVDENDVQKYVTSKYLSNLNKIVEVEIFRELWKFVFKLDNQQANDNRSVNYYVLTLLFERNNNLCIEKIKSDKQYFSSIGSGSQLNYLAKLLCHAHYVFEDLNEEAHVIIDTKIASDINIKIVCWFKSGSYLSHLEIVKKAFIDNREDPIKNKKPSRGAVRMFIDVSLNAGLTNEMQDFISWIYTTSRNYYEADEVFDDYLKYYLKIFDSAHFTDLLTEIEKNSQTYNRRAATEDHMELLEYGQKIIGTSFSKQQFPLTFSNVSL